MDFANSYAAIVKQEKQEDGSLLVYGKATDDSLDIDQQICDDTWLSSAMPEWFKSGGNVREMHTSIAAGVAKEYEAKSDGHYISVLVVDPVSVKKVESGVFKGFSIGIKAPRVVRDQKAANGRIIDGQIVEVSLVDRPANPNAKLMLAKSVEGETSLVKVEEYTEKEKSMLAEVIKEIAADSQKFDQASYDAARKGIAQLIISEASEVRDTDSDERDDIDTLLSALKHLFNFRDGELDEDSDAALSTDGSLLNLSATPDHAKCLECGCGDVANAHGKTQVVVTGATPTNEVANVSTATIVDYTKSAEGENVIDPDAPVDEAKIEAVEAVVEAATETPEILDEKSVTAIIEKAVKSATDSVKAEIAELQAATKAAEEKAVALESELVIAKSAVAPTGPKRTGRVAVTDTNELLIKAAEYRLKATATTDPILAKGYKALEHEYMTKAGKSSEE